MKICTDMLYAALYLGRGNSYLFLTYSCQCIYCLKNCHYLVYYSLSLLRNKSPQNSEIKQQSVFIHCVFVNYLWFG